MARFPLLAYLLILSFQALGLAALTGIGTLILTLVGRPGDVITAGKVYRTPTRLADRALSNNRARS